MAIKAPSSVVGIYTRVVAITPSNSTIYGYQAGAAGGNTANEDICGIWVGSSGNMNIVDQDGNTTLISNIQNGTFLPISPKQILSTSTTATNILAFYY
jgi:hypothetical protein